MSATDPGDSNCSPLCRPPDTTIDAKAHRSSIVETSMPAAFAMAGGSFHHPPTGGSNTFSVPVPPAGMEAVVKRLCFSAGTLKDVSTMPSGSKRRHGDALDVRGETIVQPLEPGEIESGRTGHGRARGGRRAMRWDASQR